MLRRVPVVLAGITPIITTRCLFDVHGKNEDAGCQVLLEGLVCLQTIYVHSYHLFN